MKKIFVLLICVAFIASCSDKTSETTSHSNDEALPVGMEFEIPSTVNKVSNSGAITVDGTETSISGEKLEVGDDITSVKLDKKADFFDKVETAMIEDYPGYRLIETVPSLDTPVCTMQTKQLEFAAKEFPEVTFIVVSNDTPFALQRFCAANSIKNLQVFSDARTREFGKQNSLFLEEYSLLTRAIMIVNPENKIEYIEYANEVTSELDLMNALAFLKTKTVQ